MAAIVNSHLFGILLSALMAGDDREKSGLQLQIAALDRAIDSLVFRLYEVSTLEPFELSGPAQKGD